MRGLGECAERPWGKPEGWADSHTVPIGSDLIDMIPRVRKNEVLGVSVPEKGRAWGWCSWGEQELAGWREAKSVSGKGSLLCKGPGALGSMVCSRRGGEGAGEMGRHRKAFQPAGGADVRLYPSVSKKPLKGFRLGKS